MFRGDVLARHVDPINFLLQKCVRTCWLVVCETKARTMEEIIDKLRGNQKLTLNKLRDNSMVFNDVGECCCASFFLKGPSSPRTPPPQAVTLNLPVHVLSRRHRLGFVTGCVPSQVVSRHTLLTNSSPLQVPWFPKPDGGARGRRCVGVGYGECMSTRRSGRTSGSPSCWGRWGWPRARTSPS